MSRHDRPRSRPTARILMLVVALLGGVMALAPLPTAGAAGQRILLLATPEPNASTWKDNFISEFQNNKPAGATVEVDTTSLTDGVAPPQGRYDGYDLVAVYAVYQDIDAGDWVEIKDSVQGRGSLAWIFFIDFCPTCGNATNKTELPATINAVAPFTVGVSGTTDNATPAPLNTASPYAGSFVNMPDLGTYSFRPITNVPFNNILYRPGSVPLPAPNASGEAGGLLVPYAQSSGACIFAITDAQPFFDGATTYYSTYNRNKIGRAFFDAVNGSCFVNTTTDYGDLPDASAGVSQRDYQTRRINNGPRIDVSPDVRIGTGVTLDADARLDTVELATGDSDDGVTAAAPTIDSSVYTASVAVTVTNGRTPCLVGFFDANADGDFDDVGEVSTTDRPTATGTRTVTFNGFTRMATVEGYHGLRVILSTDAGWCAAPGPQGPIPGVGEIEDLLVGAPPEPGDVPGAALWYRADTSLAMKGADVSAWNSVVSVQPARPTSATAVPGRIPGSPTTGANFNPLVDFTTGDNPLDTAAIDNQALAPSNASSLYNVGVPRTGARPYSTHGTAGLNLGAAGNVTAGGRNADVNGVAQPGIPRVVTGVGTNTNVTGFRNGTQTNLTTAPAAFTAGQYPFSVGGTRPGGSVDPANLGDVDLAEVIAFPASHTATQRLQVESYLAIKWGLTLGDTDGTAGGNAAVNYLNGQGQPVWNGPSTFQNRILGIARAATQGLDQRISTSSQAATITVAAGTHTFGAGDDAKAPAAPMPDRGYLLIGDDDGSISTLVPVTDANHPSVNRRLSRVWRTQATGTMPPRVTVKLPASLAGALTAPSVIVGNSAGLTTLSTAPVAMSRVGGDWVASITPPAGTSFLSFAMANPSLSKAFAPTRIPAGGTTRLTFTIANPSGAAASPLGFVDTLPSRLVVAATPNVTNTCGGSVTATAGSGSVALSGGALGSGTTSCTVAVDIAISPTFTGSGTCPNPAQTNGPNNVTVSGQLEKGTPFNTDVNGGCMEIDASAAVTHTKTLVTRPVVPGAPVVWNLAVRNNGPSAASGVRILDSLPAGTTFRPAVAGDTTTSSPACSAVGSEVTCTVGSLAAGASVDLRLAVMLPATATGSITNTSRLVNPTGPSCTADPPTNPSCNSTAGPDPIEPRATLSHTKTRVTEPVVAGNPVVWRVDIVNSGPSMARNTRILDTLDARVTFRPNVAGDATTSSPQCTGVGREVTCTVAEVPVGTTTLFIAGTLEATATGTIGNTSRLVNPTGPNCTADPPVDASCESITDPGTIGGRADMRLTKTLLTKPIVAGERATWELAIDNRGPSTGRNVQVVDTLPEGLDFRPHVAGDTTTSSPECSAIGREVTCRLGTVPVGRTALRLVVDVSATLTGSVTNRADLIDPNGPGCRTRGECGSVTGPDAVVSTPGTLIVMTFSDMNGNGRWDFEPLARDATTLMSGAMNGVFPMQEGMLRRTDAASGRYRIAAAVPGDRPRTSPESVETTLAPRGTAVALFGFRPGFDLGAAIELTGKNGSAWTPHALRADGSPRRAANGSLLTNWTRSGDALTWRVTITNSGTEPSLPNTTITVDLPRFLRYREHAGASTTCSSVGTRFVCTTGVIAPGASITLEFCHHLWGNAMASSFDVPARVSALAAGREVADRNPANDRAVSTVPFFTYRTRKNGDLLARLHPYRPRYTTHNGCRC